MKIIEYINLYNDVINKNLHHYMSISRDCILVNCLSGSFSGLIEATSTHWLDNIKTQMQLERQLGKKLSFFESFPYIRRKYGMFGLYRGFSARVGGIMPMRFMYWGVQNSCNTYLINEHDDMKIRVLKLVIGGIAGSFAQTLIDNPIELFKLRMMSSQQRTRDIVKDIVISKSFPGFRPTFYRNGIFAIFTNIAIYTKPETTMYEKFMYGSIGGFVGSIMSQPFDYIKTYKQKMHTGTVHDIKIIDIIFKNPRILWTGGLMRAVLGFCNMGIGVCAFHFFKDQFSLN